MPNGIAFPPLRLDRAAARTRLAQLGLPVPYLLYAGSYEPRKNLAGMLEAYAIASRGGVQEQLALLVEAESGHAAAVHDQVRALGLSSRLVFLHSLPRDDLRLVYSCASLFLFPSLYEGFGFPPLQAMSCGVPVVAANTSSLPELLGNAAEYVDPRQPEMIAAAICRLLADCAARERLAVQGAAVASRYTWEDAARCTLDVYREAGQS